MTYFYVFLKSLHAGANSISHLLLNKLFLTLIRWRWNLETNCIRPPTCATALPSSSRFVVNVISFPEQAERGSNRDAMM